MKIAIIGAGGSGRELFHQLLDNKHSVDDITIFDDKDGFPKIKEIDFNNYLVIVAIGNPLIRRKIVESLPTNTKFFTFIHKSVQIHDKNIKIGEGSIIFAGVILTTNITIGKHAYLNLNTTISHDCVIGDYLTTTPSVNIAGNCVIGDNVYIGMHSSIREKIIICDDVTIGLNSGVVKNITEHGVYVGTPLKKIKTC